MEVLQKSLEKQVAGLREQKDLLRDFRAEQREALDTTIPRLRTDLVARIERLSASLTERTDGIAGRVQANEQRLASHSTELEKLHAGIESRELVLASKLAPMDARLDRTEESAAAATR